MTTPFLDPSSGRVVLPLPALPAAPPAPQPPADLLIGPPRSPFWVNRLELQDQANDGLEKLDTLHSDLSAVSQRLFDLSTRNGFSVMTTQSAVDAQRSADGLVALQSIASSQQTQATQLAAAVLALNDIAKAAANCCNDCCADLALSDAAFVLIARLGTLRVHLMDLHEVTLDSVLAKLEKQDLALIRAIAEQLEQAELKDELARLMQAVDIAPFQAWKDQGVSQTDPALYEELSRRAALLIGVECAVAHQVDGESDDWPPQATTTSGQRRRRGSAAA
jgi:hypothetical protein